MDLFTNIELLYEGQKSSLSNEDIIKLYSGTFDGMDTFTKLYLTYDGVRFLSQAMMFKKEIGIK
jgi:hypothetical protein